MKIAGFGPVVIQGDNCRIGDSCYKSDFVSAVIFWFWVREEIYIFDVEVFYKFLVIKTATIIVHLLPGLEGHWITRSRNNWSDLPDIQKGKKEIMEERMNAVKGKLESMRLKLEHMERSMRAETAIIRKELQELMRMMGGHLDGNSDGSQGSVSEKDGGPNGSRLTDSNVRGLPESNGSRLMDLNVSEWAEPKERGLIESNGKGLLEPIGSGLVDSNVRGLSKPNERKLSELNRLVLEGKMKVLEGRADGRINVLEGTMDSVMRWASEKNRGLAFFDTP
ncbi:hypothetical protein V8G54_011413 [Vigna mungo]|uniref:Uncharacterized protein n=1 Tax=Vigna mungo TaxID=3915 RepID=A0AAQ3S180_VIGMU